MAPVNLNDISHCPIAAECANCHRSRNLEVVIGTLPVGVLCMTVCGDCCDDDTMPRIRSWTEAIDLVCAHCVHLGIDVDEMAALIEAERRDG